MKPNRPLTAAFHFVALFALLFSFSAGIAPAHAATAAPVPAAEPSTVTIVGSLQSELGCAGDWDPACAASMLSYDANDTVWQGAWTVPSGGWEYKAALNGTWDENYGKNATPGGDNIPLSLTAPAPVKFYYSHATHWITDNVNSVIATVAGSFQSELGCAGDWDPGCLRSWLQDPDGDGKYAFETTAIPAGAYEAKVTINESWDENYGQDGAPGGPNIPFTVNSPGSVVTFSYDPVSHILTITVKGAHGPDNNVEWEGLRHDSRDTLYRSPGGAAPAGTPVTLRLRTFHNDVTAVSARLFSVNANGQSVIPMAIEASDVSCYQAGLEGTTCDLWAVTLPNAGVDNLWYRFIVTDGTDTDYYADNTPALDGGLGAPTDEAVDTSFALMVYEPSFTAPAWVRSAFIYQIFPDRFSDGRAANNPRTGQPRYDDPILRLPWGTLPEGYCRNYADAATNCPWRFDTTPPDWSLTKEAPRGRDYFGGDLIGVRNQLGYLSSLGVTTIYFNPIFAARSNHRYDTADFLRIDPALGLLADYRALVATAKARGINVVLDGVFNHMSSDSPNFDRYRFFSTVGACESTVSPYRAWFNFRAPAANEPSPCAPSTPGGNDTFYDGWFGFDSIPVINKSLPAVQQYFITNPGSVTRYWLNQGAAGWRMDVMGDSSFPAGYWESFRQVAKSTNANAVIISETWQKDTTLLRMLRGDRADTTMNYRLRDAVIGLLTPGAFDSKGFPDSGRILAPSETLNRLASIREDYPDAAYYALMNLLDSHDTERLRWTLTPGIDTRADKEFNAANVADGKQRARVASLIQFTVPGAPTVYYGDEVGVTGDDDPDDRRTFPWKASDQDATMLAHYKTLAQLRKSSPALIDGDFKALLADDLAGTLAYGRKTGSQAAIVAVNRGAAPANLTIPVAGYLPDGVQLAGKFGYAGNVTVSNGMVALTAPPMSGVVLLTGQIDLTPLPAPTNLVVTNEGNASVSLAWNAGAGAAGYNAYRSPVSGGGWVKVNAAPLTETALTDAGLDNARTYHYIVTSVDPAGNESGPSNEVSAIPHFAIGWANLQWPPTMTHTISATDRTDDAYGQVWIDGATGQPGATPTLIAQLGFGPVGSNPADSAAAWTWTAAEFNTDAGNNDEFKASMLPQAVGIYDYVYRYSTTGGRDWLYADLNGPIPAGATPPNPGKLTVNPSDDTTAPAAPTGLNVVSTSPFQVALAWNAVEGDPTLHGYEVLRSDAAGGPYAVIATVSTNAYTDASVAEGATYFYVVRAVDLSLNRSANSNEVTATAAARTVSVTFNVTVPPPAGRSVYIAGTLSRFDGGLPDWDPGGVVLTQVNDALWTLTVTGKEGTQVEYKYALGSWDYVEKDNTCGEVGNRMLTLAYGADGTQTVNDTVQNWRNVAPCGN